MATIKEDRFYQFYGNEISWCDADGWSDDLYLPRKEFTGERVYVVDYPDEVEKFHTQWKNGQAILNKTEKGKEGNIILNGRLLENCQFISYNNDYYIPLANIVQELNKQACYKDTTNATYDIPLETGDGLSILKVPYDASTIGYVTNKNLQPETTRKMRVMMHGQKNSTQEQAILALFHNLSCHATQAGTSTQMEA